MVTKVEIQNDLKEKFGINKNISQSLSQEECEKILNLLKNEQSVAKLIEAYAEKTRTLGSNSAAYSRACNQAKHALQTLQEDCSKQQQLIISLQESNPEVTHKKELLQQEQMRLESEVQKLSIDNQSLASDLKTLSAQNKELTEANTKLKKDKSFCLH